MDYLAASGLEPQLAIPVIVVVVGALLVYVFGFQKSEEPSLEHLAVLQSTSSYKARSVSNTKSKSNASVANKPREKPQQQQQNGHVVQDKEKNNVAGKKKDAVQASNNNNKENKPPRTPQSTPGPAGKKGKQESRPEDFDSGDWIQAFSRKDKKKQVKKDEPKENPSSPKKSPKPVKEKETVIETPEKVEKVEEPAVLKEAQVQIQNQTTQTTPKSTPEKKSSKKGAKDASTTTGASSQEASPEKQKPSPAKQQPKPEKKAPEVVNVNGVSKEPKVESVDSSPVKSVETSPAKKISISEDSPAPAQPKGQVAFDEMGDTNVDAWEEAKSRGNKKRRARKD